MVDVNGQVPTIAQKSVDSMKSQSLQWLSLQKSNQQTPWNLDACLGICITMHRILMECIYELYDDFVFEMYLYYESFKALVQKILVIFG